MINYKNLEKLGCPHFTHDRVCRMCTSSPSKPTEEKEGWEEKFDREYNYEFGMACSCHDGEGCGVEHENYIKSFISQSRADAKRETIKMVVNMVKNTDMAYMFPATEERFLKDLSSLLPPR